MRNAGKQVERIMADLAGCGLNAVADLLRGQEPFTEGLHYPPDDARDAKTGARFYYHAHAGPLDEHGHFHLFAPISPSRREAEDCTKDLVQLVAISMDVWGMPQALFSINQWVSGGRWRDAGKTLDLLGRYRVEHAYPSWMVNRWITAMLRLFHPHIAALLAARDKAIGEAATGISVAAVRADRRRPVVAIMPIDVGELLAELHQLESQAGECQETASSALER
ncbi:DUF6969 family protein [Acidithiobacillus sulfuriphilus]|uniref:DUF6969 family protein n=1 Tax=Acidithiobacillus sulfuriphilus TaxID=1867749 RepID=UPI003F5F29B9